MFQKRHINRTKFPTKKVVVCEDDLFHQFEIVEKFVKDFERQGEVEFTFTSSGFVAATILAHIDINLLILDHDMPLGNGTDLIHWMHTNNKVVPILTFSGIPQNNINMEALCNHYSIPVHVFEKSDVINGEADEIIRKYTT